MGSWNADTVAPKEADNALRKNEHAVSVRYNLNYSAHNEEVL